MITLFLVRLRTGNIFPVQSTQNMSAMAWNSQMDWWCINVETHQTACSLHGTLQLQDRSLPNITHSNENLNFPKQRKCNMFTTMYFSQHSFNSSKHTLWLYDSFRRASDFFFRVVDRLMPGFPTAEPWASKQLLAFHPGNLRGMECCAQVKKKKPPFIIFIGHETLPWISHWSPTFSFWCFFALPSGSSALAATFAWWFAAGPWFHRKLSRTFCSLNHLNLKNFSIIYKGLASFSSYILSLDASVRSKLTCLWHVGSLPAWYIQLHLSFKRCLSAWFQQPSPTQLGESTLRYYKDHWCLTRLDSWATHDFTSFHLLCWNAPKASKSYRHCTRSKLQLLPIWVSNHHQLLHSFHELQILLPWPTADGRNMKKLPTTLNSLARTPSNWANETPISSRNWHCSIYFGHISMYRTHS